MHVSVTNLKDELESAALSDFQINIKTAKKQRILDINQSRKAQLDDGQAEERILLCQCDVPEAAPKKKGKEDLKFLALLTMMDVLTKSIANGKKTNPGNILRGNPAAVYSSWKYQNPDKEETIKKGNRTYWWCTNNCHAHPIWCRRKNCINCKEYWKLKKNDDEKKEGMKDTKKSEGFKVAPLALLSDNNFKSSKEQFQKTERQGRQGQLNVL
eukprot:6485310-Ditylum_brightwellii.AAC.2